MLIDSTVSSAYQTTVRRFLNDLAADDTEELNSSKFAEMGFEAFCEEYLQIQDKNGKIIPLRLNPVQRDLYPKLTGLDAILKPRQKGVTTVIQALLFYKAVCGGARTSTLCHEDALTTEIRDMVDLFYESLPEDERPKRKYSNDTLTTYPGVRSRARIATVGGHASKGSTGKRKGRGGTNTDLHGTEVAFWPDAEGVTAAAMQAGNPNIYLESTANGMTGYFYEQCMKALDGSGIFTLHFYPWFFDDEYQIVLEPGEVITYTEDEQKLVDKHNLKPEQIKWRRAKQKQIPHTFKQEYPEDPKSCFLASGISYFRNTDHVFTAPLNAQPIKGRRYAGGLDFAQTNDYTVLMIMDCETLELVDMLRINRLEWQEMRRQISVMANKWDAEVTGEANSMGTTNIELLQKGETMEDGTKILPVKLTPFDTLPSTKPPLIQGYYHALHEAGLRLFDYSDDLDTNVVSFELNAFISRQLPSGAWAYEAGGSAHDDTVTAGALMWHAANTRPPIARARMGGHL